MSLERSNLSVVPSALADTSIADLAGPRIEKFGFSFQVLGDMLKRIGP